MSTIADFNRIEDCNKIDPLCVDAFLDVNLDPDNESVLCINSSWGGACIDLSEVAQLNETLTTLYLSPEENPNCLVYEPERGDNICIHGDDLSRIISMQYLKDVDQNTTVEDGDVYMFDGTTNLFVPFDLKSALNDINTAINNINNAITNLQQRVYNIELRLTPPADAPDDVKVMFGNINIYSDSNAVVDQSGTATSLDKNHGLYSHLLANSVYGDELFG